MIPMKRGLLLLLLCLQTCVLFAQSGGGHLVYKPAVPAPEGQRFLFVLDLSDGMEKLKGASETTIQDLIFNGAYGQMRTGDTYGVWGFNREIYSGQFPMQVWDSRKPSQLATVAAAFLADADYGKSADMKLLLGQLNLVIQSVSNVTVFVVSDGYTSMTGTPFNKQINDVYKKRRRERASAKSPFVTTLIAREGIIASYSVTIGGEPILLPERPLPAIVQNNTAAPTAPSTNAPKIVITTPAPKPAPTQEPSPAASQTPAVAKLDGTTTIITQSPPPKSIYIVARTNRAEVTFAPATSAAATIAVVPAATNVPPVATATPPTPTLPESAPTPAVAKTVVSQKSESTTPTSAAENKSLISAFTPDPLPVAARERSSEPAPTQTPVPAATLAPVQAVAAPVPTGIGGGWLIAFGGFLMATALFLVFVVLRRLRPSAHHGSLITQSMDRR